MAIADASTDGIIHRLGDEANRVAMAPVPRDGELIVSRDGAARGVYVGDGVTAGGLRVSRPTNAVEFDWPAHGQTQASLLADGVKAVYSDDGTTLLAGRAQLSERPDFYIINVLSTEKLEIIVSGLAWIPSSTLIVGKMYFLDNLAADVLTDIEPPLSVPVCKVLRRDGAGVWAMFHDWRAYARSASSPVGTGYVPTPYRYFRQVITASSGGVFYNLSDFQLLDLSGTDITTAASASANDTLAAFTADKAIDNDLNSPWVGNMTAAPLQWTVDLGSAQNVYGYTFASAPADNTQEATAWSLVASNDLTNWVVLDARTRTTPAAGSRYVHYF
ncbi:MAG: discoidin domain-containing protein [Gammaproteobacteria bacterium]